MTRFGRAPDNCAIRTSPTIVLGETQSIAREKAGYLASLVPLEMVLTTNSAMLGGDLSKISDEIELSRNKGHQGHRCRRHPCQPRRHERSCPVCASGRAHTGAGNPGADDDRVVGRKLTLA